MVFLVNGVATCGKDTFADYLKECGIQKDIRVYKYSTIDTIKECAKILGWNGEKSESSRKFLSDLKFLASEHFNFSFNFIKNLVISDNSSRKKRIILIDTRESAEITRVVKSFPQVKTVLIKRTTEGFKEISSNEADADVYNYKKYDYIINNNSSLEDYKLKVSEFLDSIIL